MQVVCFGDSNTYGYDPQPDSCGRYPAEGRWVDIVKAKTGWEFDNQGLNGRKIPRRPISIPDNTDLLIVMLGSNDLLQGGKVSAIVERMEAFLNSLQISKDKILMIAPPPMELGDWVPNKELVEESVLLIPAYEALAQKMGVRFASAGSWQIDLTEDGVHFTPDGHRAFAKGLYEYLTKGE